MLVGVEVLAQAQIREIFQSYLSSLFVIVKLCVVNVLKRLAGLVVLFWPPVPGFIYVALLFCAEASVRKNEAPAANARRSRKTRHPDERDGLGSPRAIGVSSLIPLRGSGGGGEGISVNLFSMSLFPIVNPGARWGVRADGRGLGGAGVFPAAGVAGVGATHTGIERSAQGQVGREAAARAVAASWLRPSVARDGGARAQGEAGAVVASPTGHRTPHAIGADHRRMERRLRRLGRTAAAALAATLGVFQGNARGPSGIHSCHRWILHEKTRFAFAAEAGGIVPAKTGSRNGAAGAARTPGNRPRAYQCRCRSRPTPCSARSVARSWRHTPRSSANPSPGRRSRRHPNP